MKNRVSKSLQQTVQNNDHIKEVHFDAKGNHYFNVHRYKADANAVKKDKDAAKENGYYGRIDVKTVQDNNSVKLYDILTPVPSTKIVETVSRENILDAETESDFTLSAALLGSLDAKQREEIQAILAKGPKPSGETK